MKITGTGDGTIFNNDDIFSSVTCKLCGQISNPDIHSGCDRANEIGCNWYISINETRNINLKNTETMQTETNTTERLNVIAEKIKEKVLTDLKKEIGKLCYVIRYNYSNGDISSPSSYTITDNDGNTININSQYLANQIENQILDNSLPNAVENAQKRFIEKVEQMEFSSKIKPIEHDLPI